MNAGTRPGATRPVRAVALILLAVSCFAAMDTSVAWLLGEPVTALRRLVLAAGTPAG